MKIDRSKIKAHLTLYWLLPLAFCLGGLLQFYSSNEYFWEVLCAYVCCGIALTAAGYSWISPCSIFIAGHVAQYPLAAHIILTLKEPDLAVEPEIWTVTPDAMIMCSVAMLSFGIGIYIVRFFSRQAEAQSKRSFRWVTSREQNLIITCAIIPVVIIYLFSGIYYHKNVEANYDVEASKTLGFLGYMFYLSLAGPILQLRRYFHTHSSADLKYTGWLAFIFLVAVAPSGGRRQTMLLLVLMLFYFLHWEKNNRKKLWVLFAGSCVLLAMLPLLETYRSSQKIQDASIFDRTFSLFENLVTLDFGEQEDTGDSIFWISLGRRLSDYTSPGYIYKMVPDTYPYRGFADAVEWPVFLIPTLIRPETTLSFTYDVDIMDQYFFRPVEVIGGSSPLMYVGDLYSRFGWMAVVCGMITTGMILAVLNNYLRRDAFIPLLTWAMMGDYLTSMHAMTLLKFFTMLTRHFCIYLLIAYIVQKIFFTKRQVAMSKELLVPQSQAG